MDANLEILDPKNPEARAELIRACQLVAELVGRAGIQVDLGREPFDINLTADDLLAAAEDAVGQLVTHLIEPIDQPPTRKEAVSEHDHNYLATKGPGEPGRDPLAGLKGVFGPDNPDTPTFNEQTQQFVPPRRCIHEAVDISQDGESTIYCANCGWEFGHIVNTTVGQSFVAHSTDEHRALVVPYVGEEPGDIGVTLVEAAGEDDGVRRVFPCGTCGWRFDCEDDGCHT